jgi:CRISPR/Cas system CSM-associated protein Csm3 (group 7 of RAMP superfamily)
MSLSLSKFIDKLEPAFSSADCSLGGGNSRYYGNVGETIVEEDDENYNQDERENIFSEDDFASI